MGDYLTNKNLKFINLVSNQPRSNKLALIENLWKRVSNPSYDRSIFGNSAVYINNALENAYYKSKIHYIHSSEIKSGKKPRSDINSNRQFREAIKARKNCTIESKENKDTCELNANDSVMSHGAIWYNYRIPIIQKP